MLTTTSVPNLSAAERIKHEIDKFVHDKEKEIENVVCDRDSLKEELERMRSKKRKYKARVHELEHIISKALLSGYNGTQSISPLDSNNNKRKRNDTVMKESASDVAETTEKDNQVKTPQINAICRRKADDSATNEAASGIAYNSGIGESGEQDTQAKSPRSNVSDVRAPYQFIPKINKIKNNLSEKNLEKFEQSCFGHLLKIDELKFQGQLVLQLLMHLDMSASNKKRLVFKINNSIIEFGLREFCLITGLRLGTSEEAAAIPTSSSYIQRNVFMGNSRIVLKDIDECLLVRRVGPCGDELTYKLALLYFLYGILFAGSSTKQIDQQYLPLVDNLQDFYAFPWGRVAYEFLASSVLLARNQILGSDVSLKNRNMINIYGFSFALQVWAYEVMMPSLTQHCAVRVCNVDDRIPRILHWSTPKTMIYGKDIEKFLTSGDEAHLVLCGIQASPWELEALTNGTIPQPKRGKASADKDEVSRAARPTSSANAPIHNPACVTIPTDKVVVKAEMQT